MRTVTLQYPYLPPPELRGNSRAHRMAKARKAKEMRQSGYFRGLEKVRDGVQGWEFPTIQRAHVTYTFHAPRKIDIIDNLAVGMKSFLDGIVDSGLLANDDPGHALPGEHQFVRCAKGQEHVDVLVEEIP